MKFTKRKTVLSLSGTRVVVYSDKADLFSDAVSELAKTLKENPKANIGLATGATFQDFYREVALQCRKGKLSLKKSSTFNLDEYVGIKPSDPESYYSYMNNQLYSKTDLKKENAHLPRSDAKNPKAEAQRYENLIKKSGGIDLQYLGIGNNGHIGFNEPGTPFDSKTHVVKLSEATIRQNSIERGYFVGRKMPRYAMTMGIGTILKARKIIVIATGSHKAEAIGRIFKKGKNKEVPASSLKGMKKVTFMLDRQSAQRL